MDPQGMDKKMVIPVAALVTLLRQIMLRLPYQFPATNLSIDTDTISTQRIGLVDFILL